MLAEESISGHLKRLQIRALVPASPFCPFYTNQNSVYWTTFPNANLSCFEDGTTSSFYTSSTVQGKITLNRKFTAVRAGARGTGEQKLL